MAEAVVQARRSVPARPVRPRELEDALNLHVYHPLAWRLARGLAKTPVTPNQVSVVGGLFVVAAGLAYSGPEWGGLAWPLSAALGMALHMGWHVIDGADGDLARMTGRTSPRGEMVDGLCDYASHVVLYLLLAWVLAQTIGPAAWAIALAAGIAHAVQSNHVEAQRRFYLDWVHGKPWLNTRRPDTRGPFAWLVALYLRLATGMSPRALAVEAAVTGAKADPARLEAIRAIIRAEATPLLRLEKWLGANTRAIALGLSMLLTASPIAYFIYGGVWMSALLAVSIVMHNRGWARVARRIDAAA